MADAVITTPLMDLNIPIVGVTPGPDWASIWNQAAFVIDTHDHSTGRGTQITPAGININSIFSMNGNYVTSILAARLQNLSATLSGSVDVTELSAVNGNLYWNNAAGFPVQITNGNAVNNSVEGAFTAAYPSSYPYSVTSANAQSILLVDTTATRTLNLPAATNAFAFVIKDAKGQANTNNITVQPNNTDTIEGINANKLLQTNWGSWRFVSDGVSAWNLW